MLLLLYHTILPLSNILVWLDLIHGQIDGTRVPCTMLPALGMATYNTSTHYWHVTQFPKVISCLGAILLPILACRVTLEPFYFQKSVTLVWLYFLFYAIRGGDFLQVRNCRAGSVSTVLRFAVWMKKKVPFFRAQNTRKEENCVFLLTGKVHLITVK